MQVPATAGPGTAPVAESAQSDFDRSHAVETGRKFSEVSTLVKQAGLLELRPVRYVVKIASNLLLLAAGLVAFFLVGDSWWQLAIAVWLGFCGGQSAFMWHDAAHKSMFRNKTAATFVGRLHANLINGVSYGWWVNHHNRHHSFPNHLENDPDIGRRTVIFDISQYPARRRIQKFIVRYQSVLFFVLLVLEGLKMHRTAVKALGQRAVRNPWIEGLLLFAHAAIFLGCVFTVLPPLKAVLFVLVQQAVLGVYFGMLFAPNHKGMPVRSDKESLEWLERQVLTSRNIKPSPVVDFMYGGLNYQVEHHLFPAMPQMNLGRCREIVRAYCLRNEIPYHEVGFVASYREVASFLHEVSRPVREGLPTAA
ncbi:MAG TPA: acyl-CoA desaturase [Pseudonocardiaceae bacterium]